MNLLHLHYFYIVAKENGFTKASKALRVQQPAISRMVKLLEADFGFRLFEKVGRNIQLTKQGADVFEHCKIIFGSVEDLKKSIGTISGSVDGPLKIAAAEVIATHYLPKQLTNYLQQFPKVYPQVFSGPASLLFESLIKGDMDLGLFFHIPDIPEKLEVTQTQDVRFHLVVRKDLKNDKDALASFIGSREIDDQSIRRFPTLERLKKDIRHARIKISSNNLTAHKEMVLQGLGVSILPEFLINEDLRCNRLVDLYPKENFVFKMKFIQRKNSVSSLALQKFIAL